MNSIDLVSETAEGITTVIGKGAGAVETLVASMMAQDAVKTSIVMTESLFMQMNLGMVLLVTNDKETLIVETTVVVAVLLSGALVIGLIDEGRAATTIDAVTAAMTMVGTVAMKMTENRGKVVGIARRVSLGRGAAATLAVAGASGGSRVAGSRPRRRCWRVCPPRDHTRLLFRCMDCVM